MIKRLPGCLTILIVIASGFVVPATPAVAAPWGCQFRTGHLKWEANITNTAAYLNLAQHSAKAWHDATDSDVTLAQVTSGANVAIADGFYGNTWFDGILLNNLQRDPFETCAGGYWTRGVVAWWNRAYTDSYPGAKKKSVMVHELGHALGLGHEEASSCVAMTVMQPRTADRYDSCGINTPRPTDVRYVNGMY